MIKIDAKLEFNKAITVSRFNPRFKAAQQWLDNEIIKDTDKYVPYRDGYAAKSAIANTTIGSGEVIYRTPYTRRIYYNDYNFNKTTHPFATDHWFEASKAANQNKWLNGVQKIVRG